MFGPASGVDRQTLLEIAGNMNWSRGILGTTVHTTLMVVFAFDLQANETRPFGLAERVSWTTSRMAGTPDPPRPYDAKRAFPQLKFQQPVFIAQEPGTNRFWVAEVGGKIYAFTKDTPDNDSRQVVLNIKRQIYAFSFHPKYEENGTIFVFSPTPISDGTNKDGDSADQSDQSRVSRFTTNVDHPRLCLPDSEQIIIQWPSGGHNGGEAIVGPDGYLYIATGDGSGGSDTNDTGQGIDDLFSVIMRIDVDHPRPDRPYSIPPDNPFVNYPNAKPEIWAFGFRNPWRMSFDQRGRLWVGDVGQDLWEMIWLVERGGNYGWSVQEGSHPFHPRKKQGPGPILPPAVEHHHTESRSITGGYIYEGGKFPELQGIYFYGDYEYGQVWGLRHDGKTVTWNEELANTSLRIASFGVSRDGDILIVDNSSGEIYRLERAPEESDATRFPRKLSETGIFASVAEHRVAPGVISYSVNTPQWTDNATKQRLVALPGTAQVGFVERSGNASTWSFDDGTVIAETLSLETESGNQASKRRIETRILVKQENHWLGYSYLWNEQQTDATLIDALGTEIRLDIEDPSLDSGRRQQTWRVPSRNECMVCHSRAAGFVLGLNTLQMNKDHNYAGVVDNQLRTLNHIGIFKEPLDKESAEYDALPYAYDQTTDIDARARAYLHVNCSVCHVSDGGGNAKLQLRYYEELENTGLVGESPMHGTFGLAGGQIITAGDPFASVLFYRLSKLGRGRMPHIGSRMTDQAGLNLIHEWIVHLHESANEKNNRPNAVIADSDEFASIKQLLAVTLSEAELAEALKSNLLSTRRAFILAHILAAHSPNKSIVQHVARLAFGHADANVRDLFERFIPEEQRVKRLGENIDPKQILALTGNVDAGRRLFLSNTASQCKNCHKIGDIGGTLGPDLSQIGKKYRRHELLEPLISPAKQIDPKYTMFALITTEGQVLSGILVERTDDEVTLNVLRDGQGTTVKVPLAQVEELIAQKQSLMPDNLLRDMTAQEAADLLDFLFSLK